VVKALPRKYNANIVQKPVGVNGSGKLSWPKVNLILFRIAVA